MRELLRTGGGALCVPEFPMIDRADGGNLWVLPPRRVWDRSELSPEELIAWTFLIAASGRAMLDVLPQLAGGVVNYWEAGNWALNEAAPPRGPKSGREHKRVHMHLIGRSRTSRDPDWAWGEAPFFPAYDQHHDWWRRKKNLSQGECAAVAGRARDILKEKYETEGSLVAESPGARGGRDL